MKHRRFITGLFTVVLLFSLIPHFSLEAQTSRTAKDYFREASRLFITNHFVDALESLNSAIELDPNYADAYALRAQVHLNQYDPEAAWTDLQHAFELDSDNWHGYIHRAQYYADQEEFSDAFDDANQAIALEPNAADGYYVLGDIYLQNGDFETAIENYNEALEREFIFYDEIWLYFSRGNAYMSLEDYRSAIDDFTQAIEIDPEDEAEIADALYIRAVAEVQLGSLTAALADLDQSINTTPSGHWSLSQSYYLRAYIYSLQENYRLASADYTRAINTAEEQNLPGEEYAYYYQGRAFNYVDMGDCISARLDAITYTTMIQDTESQDVVDFMDYIEQCGS